MNKDAEKLLMMFIDDMYKPSGKVSKKTAIAGMKFVAKHPDLQCAVNNSDHKAIRDYKLTTQKQTEKEMLEVCFNKLCLITGLEEFPVIFKVVNEHNEAVIAYRLEF